MPRRVARHVLLAALAAACHAAGAQDGAPAPALVVQQLAPQLLAFAGFSQVVSFTPRGTLTPVQIAQVLESTRQQLIGLGVGNPTGEQIGAALQAQGSPVSVQLVPSASAAPRSNTSDSPVPAGATSRTPVPGNVSNTPAPPAAAPTPPQAPRTPEAARPARIPG